MSKKFLSGINVIGGTTLNGVTDAGVDTDKFIVLDSNGVIKYRTGDEILSDVGAVSSARTLSINGTSYDLSADRSWTISTSSSARSIQKFVATAAQTTFTITGGYTVGLVDVYVNGVKLDNSGDFTATNGSTIVLTTGTLVNNIVEVYKYINAFTANNALRVSTYFTATAGQTTFTATYSLGLIDVFYNGSKLSTSEYNASSGTSIVLNNACSVNDIIEIIAYNYSVGGFTGVSQTRTLTINGTAYDLSADRAWTLTTSNITEGSNLYYTDTRARAAISLTTTGSSGASTYTSGVINIPTYTLSGLGGQTELNGTGLVRMAGTTVSYDNATYATQSYVTTAVANLVNSAPSTLDTLNELATALGNDANFATTITTSIGTKQPQLNGTGFVKISGTTISYDNSTYLTTASASSTYIPYTGATANVDLGSRTLTTNYVKITSNASTYLSIWSTAATGNHWALNSSDNGNFYIAISGGSNAISISPTNKVDFGSTIGNGTYTYTLPSATGTLALTSNLSSYLPLAGGTLTGALGGTSATFSSNVVSTTSITGATIKLGGFTNYGTIQDVNDVRRIWFENTGSYRTIFDLPLTGTAFSFRDNAGTSLFNLTSLGAATFSSSVGIGVAPDFPLTIKTDASANSIKIIGRSGGDNALAFYGSDASTLYGHIDVGASYFQIHTSNSQAMQFYTGGSERMRINSGGSVGVGTTVSTWKFAVAGGNDALHNVVGIFNNGITGTSAIGKGTAIVLGGNTDGNYSAKIAMVYEGQNPSYLQPALAFYTMNNTYAYGSEVERMRISANGTVTFNNDTSLQGNNYINSTKMLQWEGGSYWSFRTISSAATFQVYQGSTGATPISILSGNGVRINNTTVGTYNPQFSIYNGDGSRICATMEVGVATPGFTTLAFANPNGIVGSIAINTSTVTYGGTSDYRLKEDLKDFNALDKVSRIKVYDFKWKTDNERNEGVLAHELQDIVPYAVIGEKDAVNEDNSIKSQMVDYSKLVPILTKAIQELKAEIDILKAR